MHHHKHGRHPGLVAARPSSRWGQNGVFSSTVYPSAFRHCCSYFEWVLAAGFVSVIGRLCVMIFGPLELVLVS